MAKVLHDETALLPFVDASKLSNPPLPGTKTVAAINAGIFWAVAGGIKAIIHQLMQQPNRGHVVFLTGGDAPLLEAVLEREFILWPEMTLEGIRISAEKLP
jgi:type III pantothenate kinase